MALTPAEIRLAMEQYDLSDPDDRMKFSEYLAGVLKDGGDPHTHTLVDCSENLRDAVDSGDRLAVGLCIGLGAFARTKLP